jgi:hypothetical protein
VTDGGSSPKQSTIWVVVQVLDKNDKKPQFPEKVYQIKLPEHDLKKRGEPIYRVLHLIETRAPMQKSPTASWTGMMRESSLLTLKLAWFLPESNLLPGVMTS